MRRFIYLVLLSVGIVYSQDSLRTLKISHAEPIYTDLVRDLGARKGELEIDAGFSFRDNRRFLTYEGFVEVEFAPVNRLGVEIEVPISFNQPIYISSDSLPHDRVQGIKLATQYTFLVSPKLNMSAGVGFMDEILFHSFGSIHNKGFFKGNVYNPFFVVAKKFGANFHSLLYTGPQFEHVFANNNLNFSYQNNLSFHYTFGNSGHFLGIEFNHEFDELNWQLTIHPQVKLKIANGFSWGMALGIPCNNYHTGGLEIFTRLIYEPQKKVKQRS